MNRRYSQDRANRPYPGEFQPGQPDYEDYSPREFHNGRDFENEFDPRFDRGNTGGMRPDQRYGGRGNERGYAMGDSRFYASGMHTGSNPNSPIRYRSEDWPRLSETYRNENFRQNPNWGEFAGRGPKGFTRSDDRIREDVCERLMDAPDVDASDLEVRVASGEVTLTGTTDSRHCKRRAEEIAESVSGVRDVNNQVKLKFANGEDRQNAESRRPVSASAKH